MTKAEKTKQFIIEKSAPIFNTKGIAATAMSDIMAATKLSKGSLYVHFEDKEALSQCAVDYTLNGLLNRVSAAMSKHSSAKEKLIASFDFLINPTQAAIAGGCPMLNFGLEADDTNPAVLKKVAKVIKSIQQNTITLIEAGIASGEFKKNWNAAVFATKAFAMVEGGILLTRVTGKNDQMKTIIQLLKDEIAAMSL